MPTTEFETPVAPAEAPTSFEAVPASSPAVAPAKRAHRIRTRYFLDWRTQFKGSVLSTVIVLGLLLLVNFIFYYAGSATTNLLLAEAPQVAAQIRDSAHIQQAVALLLSVVFLLGFIMLRALETHKVAGAAYNLAKQLERLERGRFDVTVRLRRGDDLQTLAAGINKLAVALQHDVRERIDALERLAVRAGGLGPLGNDLAGEVRGLIAKDKQHLE